MTISYDHSRFRPKHVALLLVLLALKCRLDPNLMAQSSTEGRDPVPLVQLIYTNVPDGAKYLSLADEPLALLVVNTTESLVDADIEARAISGSDKWMRIERVSFIGEKNTHARL